MIRALRMLARPAGPGPDLRESERGTHDLYEGPTPRRTVMLVHGVTFKGCRDPREIAFARRLARAGLRVAAIDLPGLKRCEFLESDVTAIAALAGALHAEFGTPPGLVGFSFGGGLALTAACRAAAGPVLCFGAFHSLETVWDHVFSWCGQEPRREREWSDYIYLLLVMAYAAREHLDMPVDRVFDALAAYCTERSLARKREAYALVRGLPVLPAFKATLSSDRLRAVSPAGKLGAIASPVALLHDAHDRIVPPAEAGRLLAELQREGKQARALVTPLLSHVDAGSARGLLDAPALLGMLGTALG